MRASQSVIESHPFRVAVPVGTDKCSDVQSHPLQWMNISLLIYRLLEQKIGPGYTCEAIINTLRRMKMTRISKENGYIPSYKRTDLTDKLHETFGFHTDNEYISKASMRTIIKHTKTQKKSDK